MSAPHEPLKPHDLEPDDKDLVRAFKRGEDGSYQAIHDRYAGRVHGLCRRMLDHSHDAEEAAQETFMRVFTALPNFNGRYQLGAWMSRIATNVCLDQLRSRVRKPTDALEPETLAHLPGNAELTGPEELLIADAERRHVRTVLSELAPMHRAAIALREFEGMSYADIAVALGMTEPQVKALLHRARRSFKKKWGPVGVAAFLPWRLLARLRRGPFADAHHHVTDAAVSSVQAATTCSTILQQCGQLVAERMVPAFAAIVVGAGSIAVGASAIAQQPNTEPRHEISSPSGTDGAPLAVSKRKNRGSAKDAKVRAHIEHSGSDSPETDSDSSEENASAPSPAPSPSATPTPTTSPQPSASPSEDVAPKAEPPALGFDRGTPIPQVEPRVSSTTVDCEKTKLNQRLETTIADGDMSYPVLFVFSSGQMTLIVYKDGQEVGYDGGAGVTNKSITKGVMALSFRGSYAWNGRGYPNSASLPQYGSFKADFKVDCARASVIKETVVFGVN